MSHPWSSKGSKRTIWWNYEPPEEMMQYLKDMRDAVRYALLEAETLRRKNGKMPSPIDLRRQIKEWFDAKYDYARHHINPVCRSAIAILRSFRKISRGKRFPEARKLAMRIDSELFRIVDGQIRITLKPGEYAFMPVNTRNKKYDEYSLGRISEIQLTDRIVSLSFARMETKQVSERKMGIDLNFKNVVGTLTESGSIQKVVEIPTKHIVKIQNDLSRRRKKVQKRIKNPQKRYRKLKQTRGRQRNRIRDAMHKLSTDLVREFQDTTFILEDLKHIRRTAKPDSKKLRSYLNRWPFAEFQKMLEYKAQQKTVYVKPGGTSSECPVCGEKVKHPTWKISRCNNCGQDYDRDRLASLAISLRGLDLCGELFPVSALTSVSPEMSEYLYTRNLPEIPGAEGTEAVYVANKVKVHNTA